MWWKGTQLGEINYAYSITIWHHLMSGAQTLVLAKMKQFEHSNVERTLFLKELIKPSLIPFIDKKKHRLQWKIQSFNFHTLIWKSGGQDCLLQSSCAKGISFQSYDIQKSSCSNLQIAHSSFYPSATSGCLVLSPGWDPSLWLGKGINKKSVYPVPLQFWI